MRLLCHIFWSLFSLPVFHKVLEPTPLLLSVEGNNHDASKQADRVHRPRVASSRSFTEHRISARTGHELHAVYSSLAPAFYPAVKLPKHSTLVMSYKVRNCTVTPLMPFINLASASKYGIMNKYYSMREARER